MSSGYFCNSQQHWPKSESSRMQTCWFISFPNNREKSPIHKHNIHCMISNHRRQQWIGWIAHTRSSKWIGHIFGQEVVMHHTSFKSENYVTRSFSLKQWWTEVRTIRMENKLKSMSSRIMEFEHNHFATNLENLYSLAILVNPTRGKEM